MSFSAVSGSSGSCNAKKKEDIYTKCRKCSPNYTLALRALKYLEQSREKEKIAYLFAHTVVSFLCAPFLNLAQVKPVFRLLCSFALVAVYCCTSDGLECVGVCRTSFFYSYLFKVHSLTL